MFQEKDFCGNIGQIGCKTTSKLRNLQFYSLKECEARFAPKIEFFLEHSREILNNSLFFFIGIYVWLIQLQVKLIVYFVRQYFDLVLFNIFEGSQRNKYLMKN